MKYDATMPAVWVRYGAQTAFFSQNGGMRNAGGTNFVH